MAVRKSSLHYADQVRLTDADLDKLRGGKTIFLGAVEIMRLPSDYMWGADIAARLNDEEWQSRPDLW